jgi:ankyrin
VVRLLLQHGARHRLAIADSSGETALHKSAHSGSGPVVKLLLEHGAGLEAVDQRGWTPLHIAAGSNFVSAVQILLQHGADHKVANVDGRTPLHEAAAGSSMLSVQLLLAYGADTEVADRDGCTPLHLAVRRNNPNQDVVLLLLERGVDLEPGRPRRLHSAARGCAPWQSLHHTASARTRR